MPLYKVKGYICIPIQADVEAPDESMALVKGTQVFSEAVAHDPASEDYKIHIETAELYE